VRRKRAREMVAAGPVRPPPMRQSMWCASLNGKSHVDREYDRDTGYQQRVISTASKNLPVALSKTGIREDASRTE
jgi:hypothetical protein